MTPRNLVKVPEVSNSSEFSVAVGMRMAILYLANGSKQFHQDKQHHIPEDSVRHSKRWVAEHWLNNSKYIF